MIIKTTAFKTDDGKLFEDLKDAQQHAVALLLLGEGLKSIEDITPALLKHQAAIVDIWTTGPKSRPKTRKANGAVRKQRTVRPEAAT